MSSSSAGAARQAAVVLVEDGGSDRSRRQQATREHETALHAGLSAGVTLTLAILGRCGCRLAVPPLHNNASRLVLCPTNPAAADAAAAALPSIFAAAPSCRCPLPSPAWVLCPACSP